MDITDVERIANAIQERKHSAQLATAECARDAEWDLEAYWRAKAEGLQQAESIVRKAIKEAK